MHCPSEETLARLLFDSSSAMELDRYSEHIEHCAACQQKLNGLSESPNAHFWQPAEQLPRSNQSEEDVLRRLKLARLSPSHRTSKRDETLTVDGRPSDIAASAEIDFEIPSLPGYEIIGILGRGGMGVVLKARQLALHRLVAVKMLQNSWMHAASKEMTRFRTEADIIARLQHPNIVQIYDVGETSGRPYFVLEYVAGGNLAQHLSGTPQAARQAVQFVQVLARAVHAAHSQGVIHRDLKPANILLAPSQSDTLATADSADAHDQLFANGRLLTAVPKIADFGLAKSAGRNSDQVQNELTATGELLGTPSYMSPEQAAPTNSPVGPAADVYSLGAILYELLTGRPPFKGGSPLDTVLQVLHSEPVSVTSLQPTVSRDVETICHKCLRKEPHHRYATANDLADDIERFLQGRPIQARPRGVIERTWRWIYEHPVSAGLLAAGLLTPIVALVTLSLLSAQLVRSSALESAAQQAELLEHANNQYSLIVQRVEQAHYAVNKMVPPTPGTVPLSIPATFLHDVGEELSLDGKTGIKVHQYSDFPFPWRKDGGPHDDFERKALARLRETNGKEAVHEFNEIDGQPVVRYAQARILKQSCIDCHNTHPLSTRKDWKVGDVRGVLEVIRPLKNDEVRISHVLQLTVLLSAIGSALLLLGGLLALWPKRVGRQPRSS